MSGEKAFGTCRYCGQPNMTAVTDEDATNMCDCLEARAYTTKKHDNERREKERAEAIKKADLTIRHLFCGGGEGLGWVSVDDSVIRTLRDLTEKIYDDRIDSATIVIMPGIRASIRKNGQDKLVITRTDKLDNRMEI